jgi:hypothetical protein
MSNNINNKRFSVCNIIKKSEAIELLKNNLTAEELKALIQPNYNHLIKMLKLYSKKDIQYLLYNTHKIGMDKISNIIRKNAVMGGGDSEEEEAEDSNLKKGTTNNLIDMEEEEGEEEEEINTNADLLLANITEVKKKNETIETQTDDIKQLEQLQLGYIENNNERINEASNKKETRNTKPTSIKKTIFIPRQKNNEKLVISNDPIHNAEIDIDETAFNTTAEGFMKTDAFNEVKKYKSLKKVVTYLKNAKLNYEEVEKVCSSLADYHKNRLLKNDKYDSEIKAQIQKVKKVNEMYEIVELMSF